MYPFPYYYNSSMLILIPGLVLMLLAQWRVRREFNRFSQIASANGQSAQQVARRLLDDAGLSDVSIEHIDGTLKDHYDPSTHVLRLSGQGTSTSIAAIGVAAHEVGHALQQANGYVPMKVRNAIYPVVNISSLLAIPLLMLGFILEINELVIAALLLYASILFFQVVTLPLEYNASARSKVLLGRGYLSEDELYGVGRVLNAAAMTYLASTLVTFLQFIRLLAFARSRD